MSLGDEIATWLAANVTGLRLTDPVNLFINKRPETPDSMVALFEYPGGESYETMGSSGTLAVTLPRLQVVVRDQKSSVARPLIKTIWLGLAGLVDVTLSGVRYLRVKPLQDPFLLGRDDNQRVLYACNFECTKGAS